MTLEEPDLGFSVLCPPRIAFSHVATYDVLPHRGRTFPMVNIELSKLLELQPFSVLSQLVNLILATTLAGIAWYDGDVPGEAQRTTRTKAGMS
jgi:hypothetical protein